MQTRIIIHHVDGAALTASPLWPLIQSLLWADGPVQVVEIGRVDPADEIGPVIHDDAVKPACDPHFGVNI